tara:strand:- start:577 stop:1896 length:1320 start_codon:yes stop_codon:yes gene_type:complete
MDWVVRDLKKFQKEQKPVISYMVKEFEMRKAADLYKRSTVSKTGSLNMDKLHSYSYNEDIFLKMNIEPGATNHGLVMFVDWSGSMADNFHNTLKQTINLVLFCKRVNIPFEVYGFTNQYDHDSETTTKNKKAQTPKQNDMIVDKCTLLNMLSSRANKKEFEQGLINLWSMSNYWADRMSYGGIQDGDSYIYPIYIPSNYSLGSTPLNHSIIYAMKIVPQFKKINGLQKVHTVFLTDGASDRIRGTYQWGKNPYIDIRDGSVPENYEGEYLEESLDTYHKAVTIIDPVTKKKVKFKPYAKLKYGDGFTYENQTDVLLEFLKARDPSMNVVNFFIAGRTRKGNVARSELEYVFGLGWSDREQVKKLQKQMRDKNFVVCTTRAWHEMYVLPGGQRLEITNDNMSEVVAGEATKGELKKAFGKMTSGRKNSRPLLSQFIGMIA